MGISAQQALFQISKKLALQELTKTKQDSLYVKTAHWGISAKELQFCQSFVLMDITVFSSQLHQSNAQLAHMVTRLA
jgi:cob(I)alamin adenosyltransferase